MPRIVRCERARSHRASPARSRDAWSVKCGDVPVQPKALHLPSLRKEDSTVPLMVTLTLDVLAPYAPGCEGGIAERGSSQVGKWRGRVPRAAFRAKRGRHRGAHMSQSRASGIARWRWSPSAKALSPAYRSVHLRIAQTAGCRLGVLLREPDSDCLRGRLLA